MDWIEAIKTAGEVLKVAAPVVTAGAASVGAYVAFRGLKRWWEQTVGKRKIELAEQVLVDFYKARDALRWARVGASFGGEGTTRPIVHGESETEAREKTMIYLPIERLRNQADLFSRIAAHRYRVEIDFGEEAIKPFNEINSIYIEIMTSAELLLQLRPWSRDPHDDSADIRALQKTIWGIAKDDPLSKRIDAAVSAIEQMCRPIIMGQLR